MPSPSIDALRNVATQLRIDSIRATSEAGSGHPTSCMSAADVVAALFFAEMRYDPRDPQNADNDRFVLSKGHAAPILYAAWAEAGLFPREQLLTLRKLDSDLEGHPTPRLPFVDVATGSLGQGICAAVGLALNARRIGSDYRTYAMLGDGESAEGSVWEAADVATFQKLDNLCAIVDVNGLGQSRATQFDHQMDEYVRRWSAFGWKALAIDGHDMQAILDALQEARGTKGQPTAILARTIKGKGVEAVAGKEGWHGKAFKKGEETDRAIAELQKQMIEGTKPPQIQRPSGRSRPPAPPAYDRLPAPAYKKGDSVATREAWGTALAAIGGADERIVALDADVKNSTFSERFEKAFANRFDVRVLPDESRGFHPDGRHFGGAHQAHRLARGRLDRRGRSVADGARGSRVDACGPRLRRPLPVRGCEHRASRACDGTARRHGVHAYVAAEDARPVRCRRGVQDWRVEGRAREQQRCGDDRCRRGHRLRSVESVRRAREGRNCRSRDRRVFRPAD
jgi:transketolase